MSEVRLKTAPYFDGKYHEQTDTYYKCNTQNTHHRRGVGEKLLHLLYCMEISPSVYNTKNATTH